MCLAAYPGVACSILARSNTFVEIDYEITFMAIPLIQEGLLSDKRKCVHDVLVNRLTQPAHEKSVIRWTDRPDMTKAVDWDVTHQTTQTYTGFVKQQVRL